MTVPHPNCFGGLYAAFVMSDSPQSWGRSASSTRNNCSDSPELWWRALSSTPNNDSDSAQFWWLSANSTHNYCDSPHFGWRSVSSHSTNDRDSSQFFWRSASSNRNVSDSPQFRWRSVSSTRNVYFRALRIVIAASGSSSFVSVFMAVLRPHDCGCSTLIGYHVLRHGPVWRRPLTLLTVRWIRPLKKGEGIIVFS
jgi:hypothetical protein